MRHTMKRAIGEGFPIVEINRLAVPGRNAFEPIYQMRKNFTAKTARTRQLSSLHRSFRTEIFRGESPSSSGAAL